MKPFLVFLVLFCCAFYHVSAQKTINLYYKDGKLQVSGDNMPPLTIHRGDKIKNGFGDQKMTEKQVRRIKDELLFKINRTQRNLHDDSLQLHTLYTSLWDQNFYDEYDAELTALADYLRVGKPAVIAFKWVPSTEDIDKIVGPDHLYEDDQSYSNAVQSEQHIYYIDPYKNWLVKRFNDDMGKENMASVSQDIAYINAWRNLEQLYADMKKAYERLSKKYNTSDNCANDIDNVADLNKRLANELTGANNELFRLLRSKNFFRKWLWYTEGIPTTNPLFSTTPDKEYPASELNNYAATLLDSATKRTDSINKALTSQIRETRSLRNVIKMPLTTVDNKIQLWHYDASNGYDNNVKFRGQMADEHDVRLCIHNLASDKSIWYKEDTTPIPENNSIVTALDETVKGTTALIGQVTGIAGALGKIIGLYTPVSNNRFDKFNIPGNPPVATGAAGGAIDETGGGGGGGEKRAGRKDGKRVIRKVKKKVEKVTAYQSGSDAPLHFFEQKIAANPGFWSEAGGTDMSALKDQIAAKDPETTYDYLEYEGRIYYLSGNWKNDKIALIAQYSDYMQIELPAATINQFMRNNLNNNIVIYTSKSSVENGAGQLFKDFKAYIVKVKGCNDTYKQAINDLLPGLKFVASLVKLPTRSLPQTVLYTRDNDSAQMQTLIRPMSTKVNKETAFSFTEIKRGKDTTVVYSDKVKVGKWLRFDISAGLGFTWKDYENKIVNDDNNATDVTDDHPRVHGIAGLHWYPWRIYKRDERFFISRDILHRLSVFAGVDIINPLNHYYPGVSIDLIPGIKIINGPHLYRHTNYEILNNAVLNKASGVAYAGWFTSLQIDPSIFIAIFNIGKK